MIIVVGASSGLGIEIVQELINYQDVILTHFSNKVNIPGVNNVSKFLDLSDTSSIDSFIKKNKKDFENISIIFCSTYSKDGLVYHYSQEDWKKTFDININGPFYLVKKLLPNMISDNFGRIITLSSYLANNGSIGASAYSSSKSALLGFTKSLAKEYGRFNILSNIIELGYFSEGLTNSLDPKALSTIQKKIPTRTLGKSIEIVNAIRLLIDSNYINGSQIVINGGL